MTYKIGEKIIVVHDRPMRYGRGKHTKLSTSHIGIIVAIDDTCLHNIRVDISGDLVWCCGELHIKKMWSVS